MQQKLITFAVPCYNSAAYMRHCIETLLSAGEQAERQAQRLDGGEQRAAEKIEGGLRRGKCVQSRERGSHRHPPPHSDHIPGAELRRKQESGRVKYIEHHCGIPAELFVKGVLRRPQPPAKGKRR